MKSVSQSFANFNIDNAKCVCVCMHVYVCSYIYIYTCVFVPRKWFLGNCWSHHHQIWHSDCLIYGHTSHVNCIDLDLDARSQWVSKSKSNQRWMLLGTKQAISIKLSATVSLFIFYLTLNLQTLICLDHLLFIHSWSTLFDSWLCAVALIWPLRLTGRL